MLIATGIIPTVHKQGWGIGEIFHIEVWKSSQYFWPGFYTNPGKFLHWHKKISNVIRTNVEQLIYTLSCCKIHVDVSLNKFLGKFPV